MKKVFALTTALSALAILLTACGPIHNRSTEYVDAKNDPALKLPKDISNEKLNNYYPIPKASNPEKKIVAADLTPPGLIEAENAAEQAQQAEKTTKQTAKAAEASANTNPESQDHDI